MMRRNIVKSLIVSAALCCAGAAAANPIGGAVAVAQQAQVTRNGSAQVLRDGAELRIGDVIQTNASGQAQIRLVDDTRIVVGPNSRLVLEQFLLSGPGTAQQVGVNAVAGTFRFLSGRSDSSAYSLRTPTATLGIRGTQFDFTVDPRRGVDLVTLGGEVLLCDVNRRCALVRGDCTVVNTGLEGGFERPRSSNERRNLFFEQFPYVVDQARLRSEFRVSTRSCGDFQQVRSEPQPPAPAPAPPPPPEPEPEPDRVPRPGLR